MVTGFTVLALAVVFGCVSAAMLAGAMDAHGTGAKGRRVPVRVHLRRND